MHFLAPSDVGHKVAVSAELQIVVPISYQLHSMTVSISVAELRTKVSNN